MIIGISGKMESGKDTVGIIIQYLTSDYVDKYDFETYLEHIIDFPEWKIKKFAGKLKEIVCIIIGCTKEQLEDREFKEKELGEEWRKWRIYQFSEYSNFIPLDLVFNTEQEYCDYINNTTDNKRIFTYKSEILTPRTLLQLLGTECGRQIIHPNIWVNALFADYIDKYHNWIITDVRFPNELQSIKDKGGITIRVNRNNSLFKSVVHESEIALDNATFDYVIDNNGTIDELIVKVKEILIKENII